MANVLTSFLIGIGFDTSKLDSGMKDVNSKMDGVKGSALKVSAALVGAFGAAAGSVVNTAGKIDQLALKTGNMRTSMQYVYNYGNALKRMGGDADDAKSSIANLETLLNNYHFNGQRGIFDDMNKASIDTLDLVNTYTGEDFIAQLNRQLPGMTKEQRSVTQKTLGLSDAEIKTLSQDPVEFQASLAKSEELTGNIEGLTKNSRELMQNSADFSLAIEGITNELAGEFMSSLIGVSGWINGFLAENKGVINSGIKYAGENAGATAALGAGATASLLGSGLKLAGLSTIGGAASVAGTAGMGVAGSAIGANLLNESLGKYIPGYSEASLGFDEVLKELSGAERIPSPLELLFGGKERARTMQELYPDDISSGEWRPIQRGEGMSPSEMSSATGAPSAEDERQANADALAGAISRSPIKVSNTTTVNVELDGRAFDARVTEVNERTAHEALGDLSTTTAR